MVAGEVGTGMATAVAYATRAWVFGGILGPAGLRYTNQNAHNISETKLNCEEIGEAAESSRAKPFSPSTHTDYRAKRKRGSE